jgi:hypothetical protein
MNPKLREELPEFITSAIKEVEERRKNQLYRGEELVHPEFPKYWADPTLDRRWEIELRQTHAQIDQNLKLFRKENQTRRRKSAKNGSVGERSKKRTKRRRQESGLISSRYPGSDELTYAQVTESIETSVERSFQPEFLILALAIATFTPPATLLSNDIDLPNDIAGVLVSRRPMRRLHRDLPHQEIYLASEPGVPIFWPRALCEGFIRAREKGELNFPPDRIDGVLRSICPMATLAKLRKTLLRHGSEWLGLNPIWMRAAAQSQQKQMAPSHYTRCEGLLLQNEQFLKLFDPTFRFPAEMKNFAFGSKRVLPLESVTKLTLNWENKLRNTLPESFDDALTTWNVLVGGMYDVTRIYEGLRAGPVPAPTRMQKLFPEPITLFRQKRLILGYAPSTLKEFWNLMEQRHRELQTSAGRAGVQIDFNSQSEALYCHYRLIRRILKAEVPTHETTAYSYADHPEFSEFAVWWPAWPRHFTNTYLREEGWQESAVQRFHRHAPLSFDPLTWNQGYFPVDFELYEQAAKCFDKVLFR